jgi:protein ImuA
VTPTSRAELIRDLKERLRKIERAHRPVDESAFSTGTPLDRLLPDKGLSWGTLLEWLSDGAGTGTASLALTVAAHVVQQGGALVVIDGKQEFYPPAAANLGIPLENTVIVRPANRRDALWAWEQSLRSGAVAVALGWLDNLDERAFRRLQLAAETGGSLGFLLRPVACRAESSWAEARFLVEARPLMVSGGVVSSEWSQSRTKHQTPLTTHQTTTHHRRLRVELLHCRGGAAGEALELELNDETGHLRLAPRLADPTSARGAARA